LKRAICGVGRGIILTIPHHVTTVNNLTSTCNMVLAKCGDAL